MCWITLSWVQSCKIDYFAAKHSISSANDQNCSKLNNYCISYRNVFMFWFYFPTNMLKPLVQLADPKITNLLQMQQICRILDFLQQMAKQSFSVLSFINMVWWRILGSWTIQGQKESAWLPNKRLLQKCCKISAYIMQSNLSAAKCFFSSSLNGRMKLSMAMGRTRNAFFMA